MKELTPPPNLPLVGGGVVWWLTSLLPNSMHPSPSQGEARWGFSPTSTKRSA
ncbi:hypothetical protein SAMN06295905_2074 [Devosia lucknowensis]|uniref:Uncharacterized protein n=1 Tax=Devosia lucknowensis TaxID=1096929 RepID=A0A1Y6FBM8_9HYPH|nr:hypothetical protein SAMN06295905_2074 [Devosia lucknowensis]